MPASQSGQTTPTLSRDAQRLAAMLSELASGGTGEGWSPDQANPFAVWDQPQVEALLAELQSTPESAPVAANAQALFDKYQLKPKAKTAAPATITKAKAAPAAAVTPARVMYPTMEG